jgi:hypothetical protein
MSNVKTYNAPPTVAAFMRSDAFFRTLQGPIGGGKSTACVMEIVRRCQMQKIGPDGLRRSRWVIVRNTAQQLKDTTLKTWMDWIPPGPAGQWRESERTFILQFGDVHAEIMFRPLDSPEDVRRVLSLELTGAWLNEAREIHRDIVIALMGRLRRYPSQANGGYNWTGMIADTNPPEVDSFWYNVMEHLPTDEDKPKTVLPCESFKQPSGLAPNAENREHLDVEYYSELAKGRPQEWIDTYIHGLYSPSLSGTPVYGKIFKQQIHVSPTSLLVDSKLPVIVGMDFGLTPAAVLKQMTPTGRIFTLAECVGFDIHLEDFIKKQLRPMLRNKFPTNPLIFIGDPSGSRRGEATGMSCFKLLRDTFKAEGAKIKPAATNDPDIRISATMKSFVEYPAGEPMHLIDPSCKWLIEACRSKYRFAKSTAKDLTHGEKVDKNNWSHVMEACQYADLFLLGGRYDVSDYVRIDSFNPLSNQQIWRPATIAGY